MKSFLLEKALEGSPEIKQIEIASAISDRSTLAARRAFYIPNVSLIAEYNKNFERSGNFSSEADALLPRDDWYVGFAVSYPLFQGRKRQASLSKAQYQKEQAEISFVEVQNSIRAQTLTQWNAILSSYPAMLFSKEAADVAQRTLQITQEQYISGAINITSLIQAQDTAFSASLTASNAEYDFLIDYMNLSRAVADYSSITNLDSEVSWLQDFYDYKLELKQ